MIGTSFSEWLFIRACIYFLHLIAPISLVLCVILLAANVHVPRVVEVWLVAESTFFLFGYLPLKMQLQSAAAHPERQSRAKRHELFHRCQANTPDGERYLAKWFLNSPIEEIKRENVKEFISWAFFDTTAVTNVADLEELDGYLADVENMLGRKLEPGRGTAKCMRITIDQVDVLHRSLLWYLCVAFVDILASVRLLLHSFTFYRLPAADILKVFPFRLLHLLSSKQTTSETLTYWYRPHTSTDHLPVLFIHGIGIGLYPYTKLLGEINGGEYGEKSTGMGIGVIAIELMSVSFRITGEALSEEKTCLEIRKILEAHKWEKVVLMSHSYGNVITSYLLRDPLMSPKIGPVLLIDPINFLLHLPDVAYNFIYRKPQRANEHQLYYFASKDPGVAHTLARRFFWSKIIMWKEEFKDRRVTVTLGGRDLIIDTETVGKYIADRPFNTKDDQWKHAPWKGEGMDLIWFQNLDHAQIFDKASTRSILVKVLRSYTALGMPNGK